MTLHAWLTQAGYLARLALIVYWAATLIFILMDNRSPQSTFAWLFVLWGLPLVGLLVYLFFGRGSQAFSSDEKLAQFGLGGDLRNNLGALIAAQDEYVQKIAREKPASYQRRLLQLLRRNSASVLTAYNQVEILQNASQKYPRLMEDIRQAQHSIHLLYFIWTEDEFTIQLKDALIERARAGVKVRALVDQSNFSVSRSYRQDLEQAGVQLLPYKVFKSLTGLHNANYRSHRKTVVIDGRIGYMGGMNLDKEQLPGQNPLGDWRDTHLRLVGEAALALQASFCISWYNTTHEKISSPDYFPAVAPGSLPFIPLQLTQSGPDSQWKAMQQVYFFMIMAAERKCYIQSPFFIPDDSLLEAIKAAALSGVDVRIICTPRGATYQIPYRAAHTYFADVARAGAKIYLYQKGYFHAKTIMIDGTVCAIGTANFDIRSFQLNYETMAVLYDDDQARRLEADFLHDLEDCAEWKLEEYLAEPPLRRLVDSIYRLASPIL